MSDLQNNYKLYRSFFKLPALVAYLAAKSQQAEQSRSNLVAGAKRPVTAAWCSLDDQGLWFAKYATRNGGKCEAIRTKGAR